MNIVSGQGAGRISARGAEGRRLPLMWIGVERAMQTIFNILFTYSKYL